MGGREGGVCRFVRLCICKCMNVFTYQRVGSSVSMANLPLEVCIGVV